MEISFWHQRWEKNEIGFHQSEANPLLVSYFDRLALRAGSRVFLPLCGKTLDIHWLLTKGYRVVGVELSRLAIEQLFTELGMKPEISHLENLQCYCGENIDVFVGDFFDLSGEVLGKVDAIYDRAALIALPEKMRPAYAEHLVNISGKVPQLLICFEYDQTLMAGPPFSINQGEIQRLYRTHYQAELLTGVELSGGLKGQCPAKETIWLLN